MKLSWGLFFLLLAYPSSLYAQKAFSFKNALSMQGGALNWPIFKGVYRELNSNEETRPDILLGICGASFAAAWSALGRDEWIEESYALSKELEFSRERLIPFLPYFLQVPFWVSQGRMGDFYNYSVLDNVDELLEKSPLNVGFEELKVPTLIVATRLLFDPTQEQKEEYERRSSRHGSHRTRAISRGVTQKKQARVDSQKRFQIVIFTDPHTASLLPSKLKSPTLSFHQKENPAFVSEIEVITDVKVHRAVRASIADPILLHPTKIGDYYYVTGAPEVRAVDILHHLSERVFEPIRKPMSGFLNQVFTSAFGIEINKMRAEGNFIRSARHFQIDLTTYPDDIGDVEMNPTVNKRLTWVSRVPDKFSDFERKYMSLSNFGASQTKLMIRDSANSAALRPHSKQ